MDDLFEVKDKLADGEVILDVRTPEEYKTAHIKGSLNICLDVVGDHADELKAYNKVFVHCQRGRRAQVACDELSQLGLSNLVCVSDGGMQQWMEAGYPVESDQ